uniref:Beta-hexosaminidase eukaryotic type N-terminal domain-containing protein n=1 Tax=Plectus sambesii TaxID=2011161 RepID=A0A914VF25_9BILA
MTQGGVWPLPWNITYLNFNHTVNPSVFQFISFYDCDIINKALSRYRNLLFPGNVTGTSSGQYTLVGLVITIYSPCPTGVPQFDMDESYTLSVLPNTPHASLNANQVWGVLRGLETFSQLAFYPNDTTTELRAAIVDDHPRFPHRGILYDTSRHFIP